MPGYEVDLGKSAVEEQLFCPKCHLVLRMPYQSMCGHRYCFSCIDEMRRPDKSFVCVVDGEVSSAKDIFPDRFVQRQLNTMKVACKYTQNGCTWLNILKEYDLHLDVCEYNENRCPNAAQGCTERVGKENRESHLKTCIYREVTCDHCGEKMLYKNLKDHISNNCPQVKVKCPQCNKDVPKAKLENHKAHECEEITAKCPFTAIGCGAQRQMKKHEKKKHSESAVLAHLTYLLQFVLDINQRLNQVQLEREETTTSFGDYADALGRLAVVENWMQEEKDKKKKNYIGARADGTSALRNGEISEAMVVNMPSTSKKGFLGVRESASAECVASPSVLKATVGECDHGDIIQSLLEECAKLNKRIEELEKKAGESSDFSAAVRQKFLGYDNSLFHMDKTMVELGDRLNETEAVSYNGQMIFPIKDFDIHRKNAILGRVTSIYSLPFYTGRYGYRMRLRVYLNGDGMGKGSHVSLYIVIEKSQYDALLTWPFNQRVTFTIIDQVGHEDVVDAFRPDPSSSSFQRPKRERNIASGCPLFMPLNLLDSGRYTRDNVMFVRTVVDTAGLENF